MSNDVHNSPTGEAMPACIPFGSSYDDIAIINRVNAALCGGQLLTEDHRNRGRA
ncbi:MAG: hypothetical protein HY319_23350 [Armatimonadetes bacterium]|nr:hypothetical protein [Armatimonadota bacterium]